MTPFGMPGFFQDLHDVVVRGGPQLEAGFQSATALPISAGAVGRLPADGGEVERCDREHEAFERTVLEHVPHAVVRFGLLAIDLLQVAAVEPPEVDQLARGVDLGLVGGLGLAQHRRGVEAVAPAPGEQLGRTQKDPGTLFPGRAAHAGRAVSAASIAAAT